MKKIGDRTRLGSKSLANTRVAGKQGYEPTTYKMLAMYLKHVSVTYYD